MYQSVITERNNTITHSLDRLHWQMRQKDESLTFRWVLVRLQSVSMSNGRTVNCWSL